MHFSKYPALVIFGLLVCFASYRWGYSSTGIVIANNALTVQRNPSATPEQVLQIAMAAPYFNKRFGEYMEVMGFSKVEADPNVPNSKPQVYANFSSTSNNGIELFYSNLVSKNRCFETLATNFYKSIKSEDDHDNHRFGENLIGRPSLGDVCNESTDCKPGYVWEKAMQFSRNDTGLAMMLIGYCGHDDAARAFLHCPSMSSKFFLPGSIGVKYDISSALKNRIASIQAPTKGAKVLPAKYYHVIGGAFASCLLTRRGVPELITGRVQERGIMAYRSRNLCELNRDLIMKVKSAAQRAIILDAFDMIERMPKGKKILDCNDIDITDTTYSTLKMMTTANCSKELPAPRCLAAIAKIKTWVIDFDWSRAQHRAGVQFAKENCPFIGIDTDAVRNACEVLK